MIALEDRKGKLVDGDFGACYEVTQEKYKKNDALGYREQLIKQTDQDSGTSICRILSAEDHFIDSPCLCPFNPSYAIDNVNDLIRVYNHLVFDFDTHRLTVDQMPENEANCSNSSSLSHRWIKLLKSSDKNSNPISYYRVNIEKLAEETKGFNHASCQCSFPTVEVNQFSFLDYTYLSHVYLAVVQNADHVFVLATYDGIAAL